MGNIEKTFAKNAENISSQESEKSIKQFSSIDDFKKFLKQKDEELNLIKIQIKQREDAKEQNKGLLRGAELEEINTLIDKDIEKFNQQAIGIQNELVLYEEARRFLIQIKQREDAKEQNKGLLRGAELEEINTLIDKDIAELEKKLEAIVVEGREEEVEQEAQTVGNQVAEKVEELKTAADQAPAAAKEEIQEIVEQGRAAAAQTEKKIGFWGRQWSRMKKSFWF